MGKYPLESLCRLVSSGLFHYLEIRVSRAVWPAPFPSLVSAVARAPCTDTRDQRYLWYECGIF